MSIGRQVSALWQAPPPADAAQRLDRLLERHPRGLAWFRADDVALPSADLADMLAVFRRAEAPLALAVVPGWLGPVRWRQLRELCPEGPRSWTFHQHGWRHHNHEPAGAKKMEFGPSRSRAAKRAELARGRQRLADLAGASWRPWFTPPWNKLDAEALDLLRELGFALVSRWGAAPKPPAPAGLVELGVNLDLHTRREPDPEAGWAALWAELEKALATGRLGVMLHHQRANRAAWDFLGLLLGALGRAPGWRVAEMSLELAV